MSCPLSDQRFTDLCKALGLRLKASRYALTREQRLVLQIVTQLESYGSAQRVIDLAKPESPWGQPTQKRFVKTLQSLVDGGYLEVTNKRDAYCFDGRTYRRRPLCVVCAVRRGKFK